MVTHDVLNVLHNGTMDLGVKCPQCGHKNVVTVNSEGYRAWTRGALIQNALPELTAEQREVLVTGICGECWKEMFREPEED